MRSQMKKLITTLLVVVLSGCATYEQTAILSGAVAGAAVGVLISGTVAETHNHRTEYTRQHPQCGYAQERWLGNNKHGEPIYSYRQVCNGGEHHEHHRD